MRNVRLAGMIRGENDPSRQSRAQLLQLLFSQGWDILNSNGDQRISLSNIEEKIIKADAFVFTPEPSLEDLFKAVSIFVGYQTIDENLSDKPTVLLNDDGSWDAFYKLLHHLVSMGTISQNPDEYLFQAKEEESVIDLLNQADAKGLPDVGREHSGDDPVESFETPLPGNHQGNICVFCSATIKKEDYLQDGYDFGKLIAENHFGCVSGAGKSGIMGTVVKGAVEAGGWTGGSNVPHIIEIEGLPEGLSSFWLKPDIYTRMEIMIERSDAFVIFPGGAGTVQEMLALMIFKHARDKGLPDKPVIVFDRMDSSGQRFWTPLIDLLEDWCDDGEFTVVNELEEILPTIKRLLKK
ncbi:MAG: LOG family protein [Akkermansiaceae bacterium]